MPLRLLGAAIGAAYAYRQHRKRRSAQQTAQYGVPAALPTSASTASHMASSSAHDAGLVAPTTNTTLRAGSIRLFYIEPGNGDISIHLQDFIIGTQPKYIALSYVWGSNDNKRQIRCDQSPLAVTRNLHEGLLALRDVLSGGGYGWADAICINQANSKEKSDQVLQMDRIFGGAETVLASLGAHVNNSELVFARASIVEELLNSLEGAASQHRPQLQSQVDREFSPQFWHALIQIPQLPWFGRLWTYQEAALARSLLLYCGIDTITWDSIATCFRSEQTMKMMATVGPADEKIIRPISAFE